MVAKKAKAKTVVKKTVVKTKSKQKRRYYRKFHINPLVPFGGKNPFPTRYKCKMLYCHVGQIQSDAAAGPMYWGTPFGGSGGVKINSYKWLHDNSSPGKTQVEGIWTYAVVTGVRVRVTFNNIFHQGTIVAFQVADLTTLSTSTIANQNADYALDRQDSYVYMIQDDYHTATWKKYIPIHKIIGITKKQLLTEDRYRSGVNPVADPIDAVGFVMSMMCPVANQYVTFKLEMEYDIVFFQDFNA